jgi:hypothetical protein
MLLVSRTITLVLLLLSTAASASYWVGDFDSAAQDYRIIRNSVPIAIAQLMLLQPGDIIVIDKPDGRIRLIGENNEHRNLTQGDTPFVVPESEMPPQLLVNIRHWVASWWSTRGNQNTSSMAAVSKGDFEPTLYPAGSEDEFLLEGTRKLQVAWQGGIEPFDVSLFDQAGERLAHEADLSGFTASLPEYVLPKGRYTLTVSSGGAASSIELTVVGKDKLPPSAEAILNLDVPDEIRFGHLAMILSAYGEWRFEAFQLAVDYNLTQLMLDLLAGNYPESVFAETTSMPEN